MYEQLMSKQGISASGLGFNYLYMVHHSYCDLLSHLQLFTTGEGCEGCEGCEGITKYYDSYEPPE